MRRLLLLPSYPVESIGSRSASLENGVPPPLFYWPGYGGIVGHIVVWDEEEEEEWVG